MNVESGQNPNPTIDTLSKIAKGLNVSVDDLIKYFFMEKLSILGGKPVCNNHKELVGKWPIISQKDMDTVEQVLRKGDFTPRGSEIIYRVENSINNYINQDNFTMLGSCTAALHSALFGLGIKNGDEIIVPSMSFFASAGVILNLQAIPIFCDIDTATYNIDPKEIEKNISSRTKAIIVVHYQGLPCNMSEILSISEKYNIPIIEDCAQAFGASIDNKMVGSFGDYSAFSFMYAKQLATCGELGGLGCKTLHLRNKAMITKMYGEILNENGDRSINYYTLGNNYAPSVILTAVLENKFESFENDISIIIRNAEFLSEYIKNNIPFLEPPIVPDGFRHVYHFYRVRVLSEKIGFGNMALFRYALEKIFKSEGLDTRSYQVAPLSGQVVFRKILDNIEKNTQDKSFIERIKSNYDFNSHKNTLKVLEETFVIGGHGSAPLYFYNRNTILKYIEVLEKIKNNIDTVIEFAKSLENEYKHPYENQYHKITDTQFGYDIYE